MREATYQNPYSFEEAVEFLKLGNSLAYEVMIESPKGPKAQGALMGRDAWLDAVANEDFIDYDGMGDQIDANGVMLDCEWIV